MPGILNNIFGNGATAPRGNDRNSLSDFARAMDRLADLRGNNRGSSSPRTTTARRSSGTSFQGLFANQQPQQQARTQQPARLANSGSVRAPFFNFGWTQSGRAGIIHAAGGTPGRTQVGWNANQGTGFVDAAQGVPGRTSVDWRDFGRQGFVNAAQGTPGNTWVNWAQGGRIGGVDAARGTVGRTQVGWNAIDGNGFVNAAQGTPGNTQVTWGPGQFRLNIPVINFGLNIG